MPREIRSPESRILFYLARFLFAALYTPLPFVMRKSGEPSTLMSRELP